MDEFGHGFGLHFLHDPAAVDLDGLQGGAPLRGDILVHHALGHEMKNFQLPGGQGVHAMFDLCYLGLFFIKDLAF